MGIREKICGKFLVNRNYYFDCLYTNKHNCLIVGTLFVFIGYFIVPIILEGLVGIVAMMAIAYVVKNKIDGKAISIGEAFKKSLSRWGVAIGTNIILWIYLIGLTFLFVIPGIIYYFYWKFVILAVILNDKSGKEALDYSKKNCKRKIVESCKSFNSSWNI